MPQGMNDGAVWRKCDFQIHTPRDQRWTGSPHLPGGTLELEAARKKWASDFVDAALQKGLSAIALTDHHDICFIKYVRDEIQIRNIRDSLWLFPGIEVTCSDDVQCLVILDRDCNDDLILRLLNKLPSVAVVDPNLDRVSNVDQCGLTLVELIDAVKSDSLLVDRSIVIPHFSDEDAHKSLNKQRMHVRFRDLDCLGFYIEKPFAELDEGTKKKVFGQISDWGTSRRAFIATGDNRFSDWGRLGKHECWMKLGEPTTESIRQAFLADGARIRFSPPMIPKQRIIDLAVDSTLTGKRFHVSFNDGFTSIIGGRGAGKTSVLEYLRFGIGRSAIDISARESPEDRSSSREKDLIRQTLDQGEVSVTLERDGVREVWTRRGGASETIDIKIGDLPPSTIPISEAQRRFPARAFHQKQLSTTMSSTSDAEEQLTGIAAADMLDERRSIEREIDDAKRRVKLALTRVVSLWRLNYEKSTVERLKDDAAIRRDHINKQLTLAGIAEEDLKIIAAAPVYSSIDAGLLEARANLDEFLGELSRLNKKLPTFTIDHLPPEYRFGELDSLASVFKSESSSSAAELDKLIDKVRAWGDAVALAKSAFDDRRASFTEKYKNAAERQEKQKALISEANSVSQEIQKLESRLAKLITEISKFADAELGLSQSTRDLCAKVEGLKKLLEQAAEAVSTRSSNRTLKAKVKKKRPSPEHADALFGLLDRLRISDLEDKVNAWVGAVSDDDEWGKVCDGLLDLFRFKVSLGTDAEPGSDVVDRIKALFFEFGSLTDAQSKSIFSRLDENSLAGFLECTKRFYIALKYKDSGRDIEFAKASPGQQASALLELLLSQESGTLIIDQPEEDLDNKIIMKIVGSIQSKKSDRQMIFATHNPNFVVNGDSDKVIVLRPGVPEAGSAGAPRIEIEVDGAIEMTSVRNAITETMEGGALAFEMRSRKYHFSN